ncbi:MAG: hypothetical protein JW929_00740 [Anaerolineales bacterium]|nr:hypothetical protein [Anaerolineales bacterium]
MKRASPLWLLVLMPVLWLAPLLGDPTQVHFAPNAGYSDLLIAHQPSAEFLRRSLLEYGEIPFWNPHTLGGTPFAANPLSGLYYPPLWLALLLPAPLAFHILFYLHLAFAGVGAFLLAREEIGERAGWAGQTAPLLAGIAFGGLPKLVAHTASGHLTLVLAVAWTPWLMSAARGGARGRSLRRWALAGVMAGIIFLTDPRWFLPAVLAAAGYALCAAPAGRAPQALRREWLSWVKNLAVFALFAAAVSAVLALPLIRFTSLTTRAGLPGQERTAYSLPFHSLSGLTLGGIEPYPEWVVYSGAAVLLLATASMILVSPPVGSPTGAPASGPAPGRGRERLFWFLLFLLCVLLSLGSRVPGLGVVSDAVPGLNLLRVPPRWMFLAGLALAMLAARGLTALENITGGHRVMKLTGFTLAAGGLIFAAAAGFSGLPPALWQDGLVWGGVGAVLFLGCRKEGWSISASGALLFLTVVDLALADGRMIDRKSAESVPGEALQSAAPLAAEAQEYRVYSPSYEIPSLAAVRCGLRTLDGIDPLILASTAGTVSAAAGVPLAGYSVTLPAFAGGDPQTDNREAVPDWRLLGLLNVGTVVSAFPVSGAPGGCVRSGEAYLCGNPFAMPRAWVAESAAVWDTPIPGRRAWIEFASPNRLRLRVAGPGIVVLAEAAYPDWRARVDGEAAELLTVGGWWRAVAVGPGEHTVELTYDPYLSQIGLAVTLLALLGYAGVRRWAG